MSDLSPKTLEQLKSLVKRFDKDRRYMAWALANYQTQEKLPDIKLAEKFRTTPEMLIRLALCRYPDSQSSSFVHHVKQIAAYTEIELTLLVNFVRQVESLEALNNRPSRESGENQALESPEVFAAARDNDETPNDSADQLEGSEQDDNEGDNVAKQ